MKWEPIPQENAVSVWRSPVFGGWLVMVTDEVQTQQPEAWSSQIPSFRNEQSHEWRSSITFMPDPQHQWDLTKEYGPLNKL
jgi:hypothetical protein